MTGWDHETDFLVIGSGSGAMTAALTAHDAGARVLVVEKSDVYGGSSAMSGGTVWIPNNFLMAAGADSRDDALTYLRHLTRGEVDDGLLETYVDASGEMLRWLSANTQARFDTLPEQCDYYPEAPGGKPGSRSIEATPFDGKRLGDAFAELRPPHPQELVLGRYAITGTEARKLVRGSWWVAVWRMIAYRLDLAARRSGPRDARLTLGNALMGRLRRSMLDREIPLWLGACAQSLVVEDGAVVGATIEREAPIRVRATRGVLLAAGGFARNAALREAWQTAPVSADWSAASPDNTGRGIELGQAVGGAIARMEHAWWTPVTLLPGKDFAWILVVEKSMPGGIIVNRFGRRFTNESAPYLEVVNGFYTDPDGPETPCWLVFDGRYRRNYPLGPLPPGRMRPDSKLPGKYLDRFIRRADSIEALAGEIEVDSAGLAATIERFNGFARAGKDEDFGRGESLYDRYYSDPKVTPNPSLAPLATAPFYAIPVFPGDLGTKGGLLTDCAARVLDEGGAPIRGLFATGNCMASVMGPTYPGAGGTLGPSMTFGYLAARTATAD